MNSCALAASGSKTKIKLKLKIKRIILNFYKTLFPQLLVAAHFARRRQKRLA
jgi:hypothetical protein